MNFVLDAEVVELMDFETARILPSTSTNEKLEQTLSDLQVSVKVQGEESIFRTVFEHKSYPDVMGLDQLEDYSSAKWRRERLAGKKKRTPIIGVLFYHGDEPWICGENFNVMFGIKNPVLLKYLMNFPIKVIDH